MSMNSSETIARIGPRIDIEESPEGFADARRARIATQLALEALYKAHEDRQFCVAETALNFAAVAMINLDLPASRRTDSFREAVAAAIEMAHEPGAHSY
jgi:hypothetical protein